MDTTLSYYLPFTALLPSIQEFVKNESKNSLRKVNKHLPGYKIKKILPPRRKDLFYNKQPIADQIEMVLTHFSDPHAKGILQRICSYRSAYCFIDNATANEQRNDTEAALSVFNETLGSVYTGNQLRWNNIRAVATGVKNAELFFDFEFDETIQKMANEVVGYEELYSNFTLPQKLNVCKKTKLLSKAISIFVIKKFNV